MTGSSPRRTREERGWRDMLPALALGGIGLVCAVALTVWAPAPRAGSVAAVFPPHFSTLRMADAIARAGGVPIRGAGLANIVVARPGGPDFGPRLRQAGAWFVVDAASASGCLDTRTE